MSDLLPGSTLGNGLCVILVLRVGRPGLRGGLSRGVQGLNAEMSAWDWTASRLPPEAPRPRARPLDRAPTQPPS